MGGLRETLSGMIMAARSDKTKVTRVRLAKGLTVAMLMGIDDVLALQLSRADVYPSMREWKTVLDMMPHNTVIELPREMIANHTYYLRGKVKLAKELIQ